MQYLAFRCDIFLENQLGRNTPNLSLYPISKFFCHSKSHKFSKNKTVIGSWENALPKKHNQLNLIEILLPQNPRKFDMNFTRNAQNTGYWAFFLLCIECDVYQDFYHGYQDLICCIARFRKRYMTRNKFSKWAKNLFLSIYY